MEHKPAMGLSNYIAEVEQRPWKQGLNESGDRSLDWASESRDVSLAIHLLEEISTHSPLYPWTASATELTCNSCGQQSIGGTTRFIRDLVREHINNEKSSVKQHMYSRQNEDYKGIKVKIIMSENDRANLRLY